jgi:hypothetical protein
MSIDVALGLHAGGSDPPAAAPPSLTADPDAWRVNRLAWGTSLSVTPPGSLTSYALVEVNGAPAIGRKWNLRTVVLLVGGPSAATSILWNPGNSTQLGSYQTQFSTSAAGAAAGSLTVTTPYVNSFQVTPQAAWPAGSNVVTVTNLLGGTMTFSIPGGTTQPVTMTFPGQGALAPLASAVISVPAMAGGPAYTINATGTQLGNGTVNTVADLYAGEPEGVLPFVAGVAPLGNIGGLISPNLGPFPYQMQYARHAIWVGPGEKMYAIFSNVNAANVTCAVIARVEEYPVEAVEAMRI